LALIGGYRRAVAKPIAKAALNLRMIQRAIAGGGDCGGLAWTDGLPGGMAGTGANASLAGGRPGSTTTRVPI